MATQTLRPGNLVSISPSGGIITMAGAGIPVNLSILEDDNPTTGITWVDPNTSIIFSMDDPTFDSFDSAFIEYDVGNIEEKTQFRLDHGGNVYLHTSNTGEETVSIDISNRSISNITDFNITITSDTAAAQILEVRIILTQTARGFIEIPGGKIELKSGKITI